MVKVSETVLVKTNVKKKVQAFWFKVQQRRQLIWSILVELNLLTRQRNQLMKVKLLH